MKSDHLLVVALFILILVCVLGLFAVGFEVDECDSKGGVMVQTFTGYTCVQRK